MSSHACPSLPPKTFLSIPQRLLVIIHLCIALSVFFWYAAQPFFGEYFDLRSRMLLYEYVMGTSTFLKSEESAAKVDRQLLRFNQLPMDEQLLIKDDYQELQSHAQRSMLTKIIDGLETFTRKIPPFEQAWIFFSIAIALLILLKVEGARTAVWLLPIIALAYSADNLLTGKTPSVPPDFHLFPTEESISRLYLSEPLASSPHEQKKQLEKGWKRYLIENWSKNRNKNEAEADLQEEAEFEFTRRRINLLHSQPRSEWLNVFHEKLNPLLLLSFIAWNLVFALKVRTV
jgi:hypothetical protein